MIISETYDKLSQCMQLCHQSDRYYKGGKCICVYAIKSDCSSVLTMCCSHHQLGRSHRH